MRRRIRSMYVNMGFEWNWNLYAGQSEAFRSCDSADYAGCGIISPMSANTKYIRSSILPSMLDAAAYNNNRSIKDLAFFEISNVYAKGCCRGTSGTSDEWFNA